VSVHLSRLMGEVERGPHPCWQFVTWGRSVICHGCGWTETEHLAYWAETVRDSEVD
jgi:hypothetical protein